jgi:hypothetical protein
MIGESRYWKEDLSRRARSLRSRLSQVRWAERSFARTEQDIMLGFYSIRKLLESQKLSDEARGVRVRLIAYPSKAKAHQLNRHAVGDLYDLEKPREEIRDIIFLCNQFIHSYVFQLTFSDTVSNGGALNGAFVSSDRERNRILYFVPLHGVLELFELVTNDHVNRMVMHRNPKRGDFDVKLGAGFDGVSMTLIEGKPADTAGPDDIATLIKSALLRDHPLVHKPGK